MTHKTLYTDYLLPFTNYLIPTTKHHTPYTNYQPSHPGNPPHIWASEGWLGANWPNFSHLSRLDLAEARIATKRTNLPRRWWSCATPPVQVT